MNKPKAAVIGCGYLGKFHVQKYAAIDECELVVIIDPDLERAQALADEHGCAASDSYEDWIAKVDMVSIAAPTTLHYDISKAFLEQGKHVLVEKPITVTLDEADELIALAKEHDCILQVGHLERFNAVTLELKKRIDNPMFIEAHRLAPFNPRATDVDVVLDLMIHDIDIILSMVGEKVVEVRSSGAAMVTESIDIANVRLEFEGGCVANVTASRVSGQMMRRIRVFQKNAFIAADFNDRRLEVKRKGDREMFPGIPEIHSEDETFEGDALFEEIKSFIECVRTGTPPVVSGQDGRDALATAIQITDQIKEQRSL